MAPYRWASADILENILMPTAGSFGLNWGNEFIKLSYINPDAKGKYALGDHKYTKRRLRTVSLSMISILPVY